MNYHQAPPKKTDPATVVLYLAMIVFGLPILLCCGGGLVLVLIGASSAGNGGGNGRGGIVTLETMQYQGCIDLHKRHEQALIAELKALDERYFPQEPPAQEQQRVNQLAQQHLAELQTAVKKVRPYRQFPLSPELLRQLNENPELDAYVEGMRTRRAAARQAEQDQRLAAARAQQAERDQQREAQRLADQQAREQRQRDFAANNQPRFNPPAPFNPPPPVQPPPSVQPLPQQPAADQPPPGFPATDLAQVKPRDIVYVQVGDNKWVEALVQLKRGKLVQVRAITGQVAVVTLERIRVQTEPVAQSAGNLPPGLRVAQGPKPTGPKEQEENDDDALFVAKPGEQTGREESLPGAPVPAAPSTKDAPQLLRTWTNDTGEFKVEAELISFEFDLVQLKKADGKVISIRIEKLSADDQAFVRSKFP